MIKRKLFTALSVGLLFVLSGCFGMFNDSRPNKIETESNNNSKETTTQNNFDDYFIYDGSSVRAKDTSISGDIVIPSEFNGQSITTIPANAFKDCSQITSIVVPKSVTTIAKGAFRGCIKLDSITLPFVGLSRNATNYDVLFGKIFGDTEYTGGVLKYQTDSTDYYYRCYIPSSLRSVTITDATTIGDNAFYNCSMLTEIHLNDDIIAIGKQVFVNCSNIKEISLPNVYEIPYRTFMNCSSLEYFNINEKVTTIGKSAFNGCINLSSINSTIEGDFIIPKTIQSIGTYAFRGCIKLDSITLPFVGLSRNATKYDVLFGKIFGDAEYTGGVLKYQTDSTDYYYRCYIPTSLRKVTITDATTIGDKAFYNCSMLTELSINSGAKASIGKNAFTNCISPSYYSIVEFKEDISGEIRLNGNTENGALAEESKALTITDEMKTSFNDSGCKFVYFTINYDNYGEKVNLFENWGMVNFVFKDIDDNAIFTSKNIEMKHNDKYVTDAFNHKMSISEFNKLSTLEMHFWYDRQDVLGASGNWSNQDYNVKNIKVVIQSI